MNMKFSTSFYIFCVLTFFGAFSTMWNRIIEWWNGTTLIIDTISTFIALFLLFGWIIYEIIPYIKSKINKKFNYKTYKKERLSYFILMIFYVLIFVIWSMLGYIYALNENDWYSQIKSSNVSIASSNLSVEEQIKYKEKCNKLAKDTPFYNATNKSVFYSEKKETCMIAIQENGWYLLHDLISDTSIYAWLNEKEYLSLYSQYR